MLFHSWPFLVFLMVVLPVFFALRRTRLWLPWLTLASYFFYGWWNPYYLFLVMYSTLLDFGLVALMDHCPHEGETVDVIGRLTRLRFDDRVLKVGVRGFVLGRAGDSYPGDARPQNPAACDGGLGCARAPNGVGGTL